MAAGSSSAVPTNPPPSPPLIFTDEKLKDLRDEIDLLFQVAESLSTDPQMVLNIKQRVVDGINFLEKVLKEGQVADAPSLGSCSLPQNEPPIQFNTDLSPSIHEAENTEMRYLYVLNDYEIYLLDLKKTNEKPLSYAGDAPPLPIIATANLIEKRLPVSASLLKLGSDAYIIGGREFDANLTRCDWFGFRSCKGTSHKSFRLSYTDGNDTLSLTKCIIGNMNWPKIAPRVEEIDGTIHVFDTTLEGSFPSSGWHFSHEFLRIEDHHESGRCRLEWRTINTLGSPVETFIDSHLVVGRRIFAISGSKALLFDSGKEEKQWEEVLDCNPARLQHNINIYTLQTVWDILRLGGRARCVLEVGSDKTQVDSQMYVIIVLIMRDLACYEYDDETTVAVAYLVNSSGKVVCRQLLPHFFEGGPIQPFGMRSGMIFRADVEGKMMCSIVLATGEGAFDGDYLFINTFTVKELTSFDSKSEMAQGTVLGELIRVDIKEMYIYETDSRLFRTLQACFM